ncbi:periplasmic heavy metal sensor [Algicella marina]|uniref:Periplasmic heavy metal sensor n=1 Tax=Algicella marina TaxID=2683284 RepID=A0A6P1SWT8_9RHOB|nr:periplasmic heavy metal sensor [Algicella marina]QHQ33985.1 periplasmic heavy metal sensor [Algicella marina]
MAEPVTKARKPRFTRGRILLIVSLSLNLLFIGLIAGAIWRGPPPRLAGPSGEFRVIEHSLPEPARKILREAFRERRSAFRDRMREVEANRAELITLLRAETLDTAAVGALFDRQQAFWMTVSSEAQVIMLETIEGMSAEERAEFAANLEEWRERKKRKPPPPPREKP